MIQVFLAFLLPVYGEMKLLLNKNYVLKAHFILFYIHLHKYNWQVYEHDMKQKPENYTLHFRTEVIFVAMQTSPIHLFKFWNIMCTFSSWYFITWWISPKSILSELIRNAMLWLLMIKSGNIILRKIWRLFNKIGGNEVIGLSKFILFIICRRF